MGSVMKGSGMSNTQEKSSKAGEGGGRDDQKDRMGRIVKRFACQSEKLEYLFNNQQETRVLGVL